MGSSLRAAIIVAFCLSQIVSAAPVADAALNELNSRADASCSIADRLLIVLLLIYHGDHITGTLLPSTDATEAQRGSLEHVAEAAEATKYGVYQARIGLLQRVRTVAIQNMVVAKQAQLQDRRTRLRAARLQEAQAGRRVTEAQTLPPAHVNKQVPILPFNMRSANPGALKMWHTMHEAAGAHHYHAQSARKLVQAVNDLNNLLAQPQIDKNRLHELTVRLREARIEEQTADRFHSDKMLSRRWRCNRMAASALGSKITVPHLQSPAWRRPLRLLSSISISLLCTGPLFYSPM
ncbi:hypothetical protein PC9H_009156 [Pleurotus ostreatus]|uniref:Uncharacterized protein n=1 Tax=Pleurotus ostreatus TaxID=5322 RepID=A0A8H6ZSH5_PLEOS|nr:uncharacterized protein PC9H_009156 [Pleurotus ostreatus]KAF7426787.1 hypothetical protein PC9H_009156 [Pleurotus ostreatus]